MLPSSGRVFDYSTAEHECRIKLHQSTVETDLRLQYSIYDTTWLVIELPDLTYTVYENNTLAQLLTCGAGTFQNTRDRKVQTNGDTASVARRKSWRLQSDTLLTQSTINVYVQNLPVVMKTACDKSTNALRSNDMLKVSGFGVIPYDWLSSHASIAASNCVKNALKIETQISFNLSSWNGFRVPQQKQNKKQIINSLSLKFEEHAYIERGIFEGRYIQYSYYSQK